MSSPKKLTLNNVREYRTVTVMTDMDYKESRKQTELVVHVDGVRLRHRTAAINGPKFIPHVIRCHDGMTQTGENRRTRRENLSQCDIIHHKSHMH
jgi:hypothetical protein